MPRTLTRSGCVFLTVARGQVKATARDDPRLRKGGFMPAPIILRSDMSPGRPYPPSHKHLPLGQARSGRYILRFAQNEEDLLAVQRLRFEVFNLELHEGLESSYATARDEDEFDSSCHHLMVISAETQEVVGTYRLMTNEMAEARGGFYSETEFDFRHMPAHMVAQSVEVGRACVAREHRTGRVIHLLWRGLARYLSWNEKRYLFGCCSVPSTEEHVARNVKEHLSSVDAMHPEFYLRTQPCMSIKDAPFAMPEADIELPRLFATYLNLGAKVCGGPALDLSFHVTDFFVVLDIEDIDPRVRRTYFFQSWDQAPLATDATLRQPVLHGAEASYAEKPQ